MNDDLDAIPTMKTNIEFWCDVEVVMDLTFITPMFKLLKVAIHWFVIM
jgi:hypothetical protein